MVERNFFGQNNDQKKKPESKPENSNKPKNELESSQNSVEQQQPIPVISPRFGGGAASYSNQIISPAQIQNRHGSNTQQESNAGQSYSQRSVPYEENKNELPKFGMPAPLPHNLPCSQNGQHSAQRMQVEIQRQEPQVIDMRYHIGQQPQAYRMNPAPVLRLVPQADYEESKIASQQEALRQSQMALLDNQQLLIWNTLSQIRSNLSVAQNQAEFVLRVGQNFPHSMIQENLFGIPNMNLSANNPQQQIGQRDPIVGVNDSYASAIRPNLPPTDNLQEERKQVEEESKQNVAVSLPEQRDLDQESSDPSSIPSEHEKGMSHNECQRRYQLKIMSITWNRDSHGLYDFETRQLARENHFTSTAKLFIRQNQNCKLIEPNIDLKAKYNMQAQLLMSVKQNRNKYILESPLIYKINQEKDPNEIRTLYQRDMENFYSEQGEQLLPPYDMSERMYLVIKQMIDKKVNQDYVVKKYDIIKLGRVKYQVRNIFQTKTKADIEEKNKKITRHRTAYQVRRMLMINQNRQNRNNSEPQIRIIHNIQNQQAQERTISMEDESYQSNISLSDQIVYPRNLNFIESSVSSDYHSSSSNGDAQLGVVDQHLRQLAKVRRNFKKVEIAPKVPPIEEEKVAQADLTPLKGRDHVNDLQDQLSASRFKSESNKFNRSQQNSLKEHEVEKDDEEQSEDMQEIKSFKTPVQNEQQKNAGTQNDVSNEVNREAAYCRFCWVNDFTDENPLLSSCQCSGGVRYVHLECLKRWVSTKMVVEKLPIIQTYFWNSFECEICKTPFPFTFKCNNRTYNLVELQTPTNEDYLILEIFTLKKNLSKLVHILTPKSPNQIYRLGRGNDQEIKIGDISVSRSHATITFKNGQFILQDNVSKFGTLVQIQNNLELKPNQTRIIQVGRTIMNVSLKKIKRHLENKSSILMKEHFEVKKQQSDDFINKKSQIAKVNILQENIRNAESYIAQQASVHNRLIANGNFENLGYTIQRRQMNANMDELFQYQIDGDESSDEAKDQPVQAQPRQRQPPKGRIFQELSQQKPNNQSQIRKLEENKK